MSNRPALPLRPHRSAPARPVLPLRPSRKHRRQRFVEELVADLAITPTESGKHDDRPELARARRRCRLSGATLVIAKLDRLSRSLRFIAELRDGDVPFIAADMPEANTLTVGVMSAMAQHEREVIAERTRAGLAAAKARGVHLGNPRIAEIGDKTMTAARAEHVRLAAKRNADIGAVVAEIEADAGEDMTLDAIADALNEAGYTTARGKAFSRATVLRVKRAAAKAPEAT